MSSQGCGAGGLVPLIPRMTLAARCGRICKCPPSVPGPSGNPPASPSSSVPDPESSVTTLKPEPSMASPSCPGSSITSQVRQTGWGVMPSAGSLRNAWLQLGRTPIRAPKGLPQGLRAGHRVGHWYRSCPLAGNRLGAWTWILVNVPTPFQGLRRPLGPSQAGSHSCILMHPLSPLQAPSQADDPLAPNHLEFKFEPEDFAFPSAALGPQAGLSGALRQEAWCAMALA